MQQNGDPVNRVRPSERSGKPRQRLLLVRFPALVAVTLYTSLALALTWPLLAHFSTHVPGDGIDDPSLAWNLWWIKTRLVEQLNFDIFHADWTFFPIQINLAFYTLTPLNGLLSIPLQGAFSLIIASNLILLSSYVLAGLGVYLLARQELAWWQQDARTQGDIISVALFAGVVYAFASSKLFYASLGQFNIASSQWIPFCVLFVLRMGRLHKRRQQLRSALLAGIFFTFQAWAELTYASFLLIFIALWLLWQLLVESRNPQRAASPFAILRTLVVMGSVAALGISPFLAAMLPDLRSEGNFFSSGGGFADIFSADLVGYLLPTRLHPLLGEWVQSLPFPNNKGQQIFTGYSLLVLAGAALVGALRKWQRPRTIYFWLLSSLLFFLLTLGPHLRWLGKDLPIPGPFELVSRLPFFSGNRYPSRYGVMLLLSLAILAAIGMLFLAQMWRRPVPRTRRYALLFTLLFLGEHLSIPLPLSDFRVPAIYERIAQTAGDFTLLELPTGWRNGALEIGRRDVIFMMQQWYQTTHGKRRLAGNTSRNPPYKFQYFSEAPLLDDLIALMNGDQWFMSGEIDAQWQRMVDEARRDAPQVLGFLGVRFITLHVERATPQLVRFVNEALPVTLVESWQGNDWTGAPSTIQLYEVNAAVPFGEVDLRSEMGKLYQAEGWSALAGTGAAIRPTATVMVNLPDSGGVLEVEISDSSGVPQLWLNGKRLVNSAVAGATQAAQMQTQRFEIPAGLAEQFVDRLEFRFSVGSPLGSNAGQHEWQLAGHNYTVPIALRSAGLDVGSFGQIFVNGSQVAGSQRGYNLVAIAEDGSVLASVVFDTFGNCGVEPPDESAGQAMADWLQQWPAQTLIAGAAADEASCRLSQAAVDALHRIGVHGDLRGRFRWSHVFVGAVGAQPGSAMEAMALLRPAQLTVGEGMDSPIIYGRIGNIRYLPNPSPSADISTP